MKEKNWEAIGEAVVKAFEKAIDEIAAELDTEESENTTSTEKCEKCAAQEEEKREKCERPHSITVTYYDGEEEDCAVIYPEEGARAGANATYVLAYAIGEVMAREALVDKDKAAQAILRAIMKFGAKEAGLV